MMLIRLMFYFCLSYFVLSLDIGGRTIFDRIDTRVAPYSEMAQTFIVKSSKKAWLFLKDTSLNLIGHHIPEQRDRVSSGLSSPTRQLKIDSQTTLADQSNTPEDTYTLEERMLLKKILEESR
ncbi:MAG: hypothetical protein HYV97_14590 [Bdellovibrio sp.]|nr:hypothetical protein [Bdellovibrio sp.]